MKLRSRRSGVLFFCATLLILATVAFLIVRDIESRRRSETLSQRLERHDAVEDGTARRREEFLEDAARLAQTQREWLSVLKRAVADARQDGSWERARSYAMRATEELPGSEALWAVAAYTTMRAGKDAGWIAREHLAGEQYSALRAEALLRSTRHESAGASGETEADSSAGALASEAEGALTVLGRESDPEAFRQAYELTGDRRFLLDAAMRYAERGAIASALESAADAEAHVAGAYLAYDLGHLKEARDHLEQLAPQEASGRELAMLRADIAHMDRSNEEAVRIYREVIATAPDLSPIPYRNLLWYRQIAGERLPVGVAEAPQLARSGAERFPGDTTLVKAATIGLYEDEPVRAETFLEERVSRVKDPGAAALLAEHLFERSRSLNARFARLWQLWNEYESVTVARYIGWLASSVGNREELDLIVRAAGSERIPHYAGLLAADKGQRDLAIDHFRNAFSNGGAWHSAANAAALQREAGADEESLSMLERAIGMLEEVETAAVQDRGTALGILQMQRALTLSSLGRTETAFQAIERALTHAPSLDRARVVRRRLADAVDR